MNEGPSAIALFDSEMVCLAASDRWTSDYHLKDDPVGRSHYEVFPEITEDLKAIHRRALAGETIRSEATPYRRADGSTQWVEWAVWPWLGADGRIGGIVISSFLTPAPAEAPGRPDRSFARSAGRELAANHNGAAVPPPSRSPAQRDIVRQLRHGNLLLADLPDDVFGLFADHFSPATASAGEVMVEGFDPPETIWFPLQGLYSVVRTLEDGTSSEVLTGGKVCHGGLSIFLDDNDLERETICLMGGAALVLRADRFRDVVESSRKARDWFQAFVQQVMAEIMRAAVCASHHSVPQRIARWLLLASERSGQDGLAIHQETIAMLLGVRRTGVSTVLADMRRDGLVGATRGRITIENRSRLISAACPCYREDHAQTRQRMAGSNGGGSFDGELDVAELIDRFERSGSSARTPSTPARPEARGGIDG